ncbi:MAG: glycerol-3-phosphate acyltransferase [Anaerolineae bacterium]|nr:MAG: glycerol-3-phosphate acyltransferase [Anaerolineae bacterium]
MILFFLLLGYLSGSLPFAVWITRWRTGTDIRATGSGHATTTNVIRTQGFGWGALVLLLDITKGFLPVYLVLRLDAPWYWAVLTGVCAVAGHIWPLFAGFRGGMGLATTAGGLLALYPLSFPVGLGILIVLLLTLRHGARASVFAALALAPVYIALHFPANVVWFAALDGVLIAVRFASDWQRQYRELWLDREN